MAATNYCTTNVEPDGLGAVGSTVIDGQPPAASTTGRRVNKDRNRAARIRHDAIAARANR